MEKSNVKKLSAQPIIEAIDLFCGIGGLSFGLKNGGIHVLAGYDLDSSCQYAFEANNGATFHYKDIKEVMPEEILNFILTLLSYYQVVLPVKLFIHILLITRKNFIINMYCCMNLDA